MRRPFASSTVIASGTLAGTLTRTEPSGSTLRVAEDLAHAERGGRAERVRVEIAHVLVGDAHGLLDAQEARRTLRRRGRAAGLRQREMPAGDESTPSMS